MNRFLRLSTAALFLAALTACSDDSNKNGTIGVSLPTKTEARWVSDGDSIVKALQDKGYAVDLQYAQYEVPTQLSQVENMLTKGVKTLVVAPIDGTTMSDVLARAKKAGIKIISYDRLIRNTKDVDYYVTFDNRQTGVLQGESIVDSLKLKDGAGPFNLEIVSGSLDDNNAHVVYGGMMSVLKPYIDSGKLVVRSGQVSLEQTATPNWDGALAQARMDNLLSSFYGSEHLDAVLAMNDGTATGVISSLKGVGYGKAGKPMPVVTGQDGELQNVKAIIAGDQTSTVFKDTRALALAAADMVDASLKNQQVKVNDEKTYDNGAMVVPTMLLPPQTINTANWKAELIDKAKFYTEAQVK